MTTFRSDVTEVRPLPLSWLQVMDHERWAERTRWIEWYASMLTKLDRWHALRFAATAWEIHNDNGKAEFRKLFQHKSKRWSQALR